jgi:hypothetical protein
MMSSDDFQCGCMRSEVHLMTESTIKEHAKSQRLVEDDDGCQSVSKGSSKGEQSKSKDL